MRKLYTLLVVALVGFTTQAQIVTIPDANFKAKLLAADTTNSIALNNTGINMKIDTNNDNEIQESEALAVYKLRVRSSGISDLSGIEHFTNLISLDCEINQITSLDVSSLTNLKTLGCSNNQLTTLDVSNLTQLYFLTCRFNQLNTLNLGNINGLGSFDCWFNQLTSLDLSHNTMLEYFRCSNNLLTTLDLSGLSAITTLFCNFNLLTTLDVSEQSSLQIFSCDNNLLTYLNIKNTSIENPLTFSGNPNLAFICTDSSQVNQVQGLAASYGYTNCTVDSSCLLNSTQNESVIRFSIYPNPVKSNLTIQTNATVNIKSLEIRNILGQLIWVIPSAESISSIDVSSLKTGTYFIKVASDKGTANAKFIKE